jgi:AraC-like DNA-binding protein
MIDYDPFMGQEDEAERDLQLVKTRLKSALLKRLVSPGIFPTAIEGLFISRRNERGPAERCFYRPLIGVLVQGAKHCVIGGREYRYGGGDCIAVGMELPAITEITEASEDAPLLAAAVDFRRSIFAELKAEPPLTPKQQNKPAQCAVAFKASAELMDAFLRLVRLPDKPERIPVLAPLLIREIHYLTFSEPASKNLCLCGIPDTNNANIAEAIAWLKRNYRKPLRVEELAGIANMSSPTFHRHFREITSFSPIQFQKLLRLNEARRLLLAENKDAVTAAQEVGYESATQFNREYKRLYGEPPHRDMVKLLSAGAEAENFAVN